MQELQKLKQLGLPFAELIGIEFTEAAADPTTVESKTNFIAAAPLGARLRGEATPVHRGRRTQVWQTRITLAESGRLVALVSQTQLVL
jgi:1,4-dihydroxy-2-naphthoyl-CoA hydrolase